jgi:uncharacterized PurR-regulated membrane protein YhhQ (DUF165 family)
MYHGTVFYIIDLTKSTFKGEVAQKLLQVGWWMEKMFAFVLIQSKVSFFPKFNKLNQSCPKIHFYISLS